MITTCYCCCEEKECDFIVDPYIAEVFPEDAKEPHWMCGDCIDKKRDDV